MICDAQNSLSVDLSRTEFTLSLKRHIADHPPTPRDVVVKLETEASNRIAYETA